MTSVTKYPLARSERLVIENIGDESVIYDLDTNVAHALKPLAAAVFMYADGERSLTDIAELAGYRLEGHVTEVDVADAVDQLQTLALLDSSDLETNSQGISRRAALKAFAVAGAGTVLVSSVAAPAALASTCVGLDCGSNKAGITNGSFHYPQPTSWSGQAPNVTYGGTCTYTGPGTDGTCTTTTTISASSRNDCSNKGGSWNWSTHTCTKKTQVSNVPQSSCQGSNQQWSGNGTQNYTGSWQCVPCDHCFGYQCCQVVCAPAGTGGGWGAGYKYSVGPEYGYAGFWGKYCTPENNTCAPHCS